MTRVAHKPNQIEFGDENVAHGRAAQRIAAEPRYALETTGDINIADGIDQSLGAGGLMGAWKDSTPLTFVLRL